MTLDERLNCRVKIYLLNKRCNFCFGKYADNAEYQILIKGKYELTCSNKERFDVSKKPTGVPIRSFYNCSFDKKDGLYIDYNLYRKSYHLKSSFYMSENDFSIIITCNKCYNQIFLDATIRDF